MKKLIVLSCSTLLILGLSSCGSSKPAIQTQATSSELENPYGKQVFQTECEKLAEAMPNKRAYGKAEHFKESSARELAELDARAQLSRNIDAAIISAAKRVGINTSTFTGDDVEGAALTEGAEQQKTYGRSISQNIVNRAIPIKTEKFYGKNRKYTVFVCLEYNGTPENLAHDAAEAVKNRISDKDRARYQKDFDGFEKEILDELNK